MKNGFTLVELIVVIAIIGVLASILVPAMIGYVRDSRLTAANANAKTIFNAVNQYTVKSAAIGYYIKDGIYTGLLIDTNDYPEILYGDQVSDDDVKEALLSVASCSLNEDADGTAISVQIKDGKTKKVIWSKNTTDECVGSYPDPCEDTTENGLSGYNFDA